MSLTELNFALRKTFLFLSEREGQRYIESVNKDEKGFIVKWHVSRPTGIMFVTVESASNRDLNKLAQMATKMGSTGETQAEQGAPVSAAQAKVDAERKEREAKKQELERQRDQQKQQATQKTQQGLERQRTGVEKTAANEKERETRNQKQAEKEKEADQARRDADQRRWDQVQRAKDRETERETEPGDIAQTVAQAAFQGAQAALSQKNGEKKKKGDEKEKKEHMLSFRDYMKEVAANSAGGGNISGLGDDPDVVVVHRPMGARRMKDCSKCKGQGCEYCVPEPVILSRAGKVAESVMRQLKAQAIAKQVVSEALQRCKSCGKTFSSSAAFSKHAQTHIPKREPGETDKEYTNRLMKAYRSQNEAVENLDIPAEPTTQTYAGSPVFKVDPDTFAKCCGGRRKWSRWSNVLNLEDEGHSAIRDYANKYPKRPIVVQCSETGDMKFLRFNRKGGGGNRRKSKYAPTPTDGGTGQIVFDAENVREEGAPYQATNKGMQKGYWKVVDRKGNTVRSGFKSASIAREVADSMNKEANQK